MTASSQPITRPLNPSIPAGLLRFAANPWGLRLIPSFADCFFVAILVWLFLAGASGWKALLMDGDTGWHIRTGEYILDHRVIPTADIFSYSKPGQPWFAWEWLSDVVFALLFRWAGLKGVVFFAGIVIACFATVVLRFTLWKGANLMVALPVVLLAVGSSTIHFLARPHLFTLLLLPAAIWMLEADRRSPSRRVLLLIPVTAVWTNLHGGFAVFLVCLALLAVGSALEEWLQVSQGFGPAKRYALLLVGCVCATILNPFGLGLHRHIFAYLQADWIRNLVQEFQAPTFRSEGQLQFEVLLIAGLMLASRLIAERRVTEVLWIVFLAHSALTSVRHAPLFAAVSTPLLATSLTELWMAHAIGKAKGTVAVILLELGSDLQRAFARNTIWVGATLTVILAVGPPIVHWPIDFPVEAFPVAMVQRHRLELAAARTFTTDQWGDYLIFSSYPQQKVFIDGRSDFYGEDFGKQYLSLMQGAADYEGVLAKHRFEFVLTPVEWPLSQMLKLRQDWKIVEDDGKAILFRSAADSLRFGPNENSGLSRRY